MIMGDTVTLKNGMTGTYVESDEDSGWPLIEIPGQGLVAVHPAELEEGWSRDY